MTGKEEPAAEQEDPLHSPRHAGGEMEGLDFVRRNSKKYREIRKHS